MLKSNGNKAIPNAAVSKESGSGYVGSAPAARSLAANNTPAITVWAVIGSAWLSLAIYGWGSWIMSADFKTTPTGSDAVPQWLLIWTRSFEALSFALGVFSIYYLVVKPYRRTGKMSWDGLLLLASVTLYFQDPWLNYSSPWFLYNSAFTNFGSWVNFVPGWMSPNGNLLPEPVIAISSVYTWFVVFPIIAGCWVMRRAKEKYPNIGTLSLVLGAWVFFSLLDLILEGSFVGTGLYAYASTIPEWTLFAGTTHQFPIYESVVWGACWAAMALFRFYRDDKGLSIAERGAEKLKISERSRTFVRWLALVGFMQMCMLVLYNVPIQWFATHGSAMPNYPSYFMNGICGPETRFDCPSESTPIARTGNLTNRVAPINMNPAQQ